MNKRQESNKRVKKQITDTLFALMEHKSLSDISITELVANAHVARASFYRNYSSKENVLTVLIQDILEEFRAGRDYDKIDYLSIEHIEKCFSVFADYEKYVLDLYRCGYAAVLLDELNRFHEAVAGDMPSSSVDRYSIYMYIGALFDTAVMWLGTENRASIGEIAERFCKFANAVSALKAGES